MMSETEKDAPRGATPPPVGDTSQRGERNEDSGLHDVKSLAQTTKQRISRRITSQHDAYEESLLSSSQSGLRAVALPAPAQVVSLPSMPTNVPGAADIAGAEAAGITPIEAARGPKSKAIWFVAGGGVLAAAAVAIFFIASGGAKKNDEALVATGAAAGSATSAEPALKEAAGAAGAPGVGGEAVGQGAAAGSGSPATTVVAMDPSAPPPAEEATATATAGDTADTGEKNAPAAKAETRTDRGASRSGAGGSGGGGTATSDKQAAKGKKDAKAGAGGGGGGAAPKGGVGGDSMEELLAAASGGAQKPTEGTDTGPAKPEKTGLDGKDIRSGMGAVAKQAQGCFDQHGVAGHVKIKATVDPSGKVTKADAQGEFAGTPTGSCVAAAAKSASFPAWTGAPMTISYGFTLTE